MTQSQKFTADPRLKEAKQNILDLVKEYQKPITGIKPANSENKQSYEETLKSFGENRGGNLFLPYLGSGLGNGTLVELADGSVKYDFIIGIGVHYFGHSHLGLIEKSIDAALSDTVMEGNLQQNTDSPALTNTLLQAAQRKSKRLKHCFLTSSGAMAAENAFKIVFQNKTPASRVLCFENCFMGRTLTMSQTTDNPNNRVGLPKTIEVSYVPYFDANIPEESTAKAVETLKSHLENNPGEYAAMCFELVLGEGGFYPGEKNFFQSLMKVLKENNVAVLVDEVQTFLRLPEPFAFQYFGLEEYVDIVWVGKASQACATFFTTDMKPKPGLLSQTYTSSTTAIRTGHHIVETLLNGGFFGENGKINKFHEYFVGKLKKLREKYPDKVNGPYGIGAMVAFTPLDGSDKVKEFVKKLYDEGVISFFCGKEPKRVRFLLPMGAITETDIDNVVQIIEKVLCSFDP